MTKQETAVRTEVFVTMLMQQSNSITLQSDVMKCGYNHGWLTDQDITECNLPLLKKHCARIIHEFLRLEKKEADEIDSGPAGKLQDLFDCRVCAGHIMQVYTKGIMDGYMNQDGRYVFGTEDYVTPEAAEEIIRRAFLKELRKLPEAGTDQMCNYAEKISFEQASVLLQDRRNTLLIDVRTAAEYGEWHLQGALHFAMTDIMKNPYTVSERRDIHLLLYCEKGYMSEAAAQSLSRAGYRNVFYFACEYASRIEKEAEV